MLIDYVRRHYKFILLMAAFVGIFAVVFSLYDLPIEAVLYASLLCIAVGGVVFIIGYLRFESKHKTLMRIQKNITITLDTLPIPNGILERDYIELLTLLRKEMCRIEEENATKKRDMTDYYTLWAHQIKTPIAAMRLLLQSEECAENASLQVELMRIEQYVEMVLSYIKLGSETTDYVLKECNVDDLVRQSLRKYAKLFIIKKLPLNFTETGIVTLTDEKWLAFVIEQILSNSLKYTYTGNISIYGIGKKLIISDTGIGIRPEDLPRVGEKGFTGYNGREDKKSTGIGLYLCRCICERLNFSLTVDSEYMHGTTVTIDLNRKALDTE